MDFHWVMVQFVPHAFIPALRLNQEDWIGQAREAAAERWKQAGSFPRMPKPTTGPPPSACSS